MGDMLSLAEAAALIRKSEKTIYRYVRQKKLPAVKYENNGRQIYKIRKTDLVKFSEQMRIAMGDNMSPSENLNSQDVTHNVTNNSIKAIVEEVINSQREQLMKPMEQQALFLAGKYQAENEFLREQVETLRQELEAVKALPVDITKKDEEIRILQEQFKILPKIKDEIQQYKAASVVGIDTIRQLTEEKAILKEQLSILPVAPEKIPELLKLEAEKFSQMEEKCIKEVQEKEDIKKALQEEQEQGRKQTQEKEHIEEQFKKLQQEAEEMRQKLNRPWWKFW